MVFYKKSNGYSVSLAEQALSGEFVKLAGKQLEVQYEFEKSGEIVNGKEKMKRTDKFKVIKFTLQPTITILLRSSFYLRINQTCLRLISEILLSLKL